MKEMAQRQKMKYGGSIAGFEITSSRPQADLFPKESELWA